MQQYKFFDERLVAETSHMLQEFPDCLKIAFIDCKDKGDRAQEDNVHERQERVYSSCLIDRNCEGESPNQPHGRKRPRFSIELPGYPILGDGKGDNQNHAIPFMRGAFAQCIDANQGAYFEQMLMLPCVLGEFRGKQGKQIIGFPEQITSDIGSVGDMAASAEMAFGTILQRSMTVLGARMHYGHPDIMSKQFMMQQGGVSKATKTLNLSEDIFAGMDFVLRGDGRSIRHCEYFHLTKGRDLGFNTVLAFFSKLASGTGEQIITRQMYRLGQSMHLPEMLTFYYAHVGYYFNQFFISWSMPLLACVWLLVLVSDCEARFEAFQTCNSEPGRMLAAEIMAETVSKWFSWLIFLFLVATSIPLVFELWLERSLKTAIRKLLAQLLTLSPLLFIFQAKTIGSYLIGELRFGGATYVSTGRGLPTERRPLFMRGKQLFSGLYLDYAVVAYYDGVMLLALSALVFMAGGVSEAGIQKSSTAWVFLSVGLTAVAWLYAPFLFNPYMFSLKPFWDDVRSWFAFFLEDAGNHWVAWYTEKQLKPKKGPRHGLDAAFLLMCFLLLTWCEVVSLKVQGLAYMYSAVESAWELHVMTFMPPVLASLALCVLASCFEGVIISFRSWLQKREAADAGALDLEDPPTGDIVIEKRTHCSMTPVALIAVLASGLDIAETAYALRMFYIVGWTDAVLAGSVLKLLTLVICLCCGEDLLRSRCFRSVGCFGLPLQLWVRAHRMSRDLLTSSIILGALVPLVILNGLNNFFCPGCSIHQLLIFRDHKPPARQDFHIEKREPRKPAFGKSFWQSEKTGVSERTHRTGGTGGLVSERTFKSERTQDLEDITPKTPVCFALGSSTLPECGGSSCMGSPIDSEAFTFGEAAPFASDKQSSSGHVTSSRQSGLSGMDLESCSAGSRSSERTGTSSSVGSTLMVPPITGFQKLTTLQPPVAPSSESSQSTSIDAKEKERRVPRRSIKHVSFQKGGRALPPVPRIMSNAQALSVPRTPAAVSARSAQPGALSSARTACLGPVPAPVSARTVSIDLVPEMLQYTSEQDHESESSAEEQFMDIGESKVDFSSLEHIATNAIDFSNLEHAVYSSRSDVDPAFSL
jgi:hypothetical protein